MALRAGYWGIKKLLSPLKLFKPGELGIDQDALVEDLDPVFFTRSEQAVLGAKNRMVARFNRSSGSESGNVTMTYGNDRIISLSGTAGAGAEFDLYRRVPNNNDTDNYVPIGKYKYTIGESIPAGISVYVATTYNGAFKNISGNPCPGGVEFEITADTQSDYKKSDGSTLVAAYFAVANGTDTTGIKLYPMISFDGGVYAPPAMTNQQLTDRLVKDAIHQTVTEKGLGFNFMRKDNVVLVEFVGEATEAIANDAKIIDIPSDYTMAINEHAFTLYKNNISGGAIGIITIKADGIYANTAIAIGDKPRGSFTFAYAAGPSFTRSLPDANRTVTPEEADPEAAPATRSTKKSTKSTTSADNNE